MISCLLRKFGRSRLCLLVCIIVLVTVGLYMKDLLDRECKLSYLHQLIYGECVHFNTTIISEIKRSKTKSWKSFHPKTILTLFTTFDINMQQEVVYENVLKNWKNLKNVSTILFYENDETKQLGLKYNWRVLPVPKRVCETPVLRTMFEAAQASEDSQFYGFANADILFSSDITITLEKVLKKKEFDLGSVFLTGRRVGVNISAFDQQNIDSEKDVVTKWSNRGELYHDMAADYFITNKIFLWKFVPDLIVGRPIIDNWLIWFSRLTDSKSVDFTLTVMALHQKVNGCQKKVNLCNHRIAKMAGMLPHIPIWKGSIECSQFSSFRTVNMDITFLWKPKLLESCNWRKIRYEK